MNFKFKKLDKKVIDFLEKERDGLLNHLRTCSLDAINFFETMDNDERIWEKNIPLWVGEYFILKGYPAYKMNGNYKISNDMFSHMSKKNKVKNLLLASGKSDSKNHADFALFAEDNKKPIVILEIKSQMNNKSKIWDDIFEDILVIAGHQVGVAERGVALYIFINMDRYGKKIDATEVLDHLHQRIEKFELKEFEKEIKSFMETHFYCIF